MTQSTRSTAPRPTPQTGRHRRAVLAIDEGTTGTRAALVHEDGTAGRVAYRRIHVAHPDALSVEQDPLEIWQATLDVCREVLAAEPEVALDSVALTTQRATALLWDRTTGEPLLPAVVWQDRRHAQELLAYEAEWDPVLLARTGRPVGSRAPFLWAARQLRERPEVAAAYRAGRLLFGTVDTWLIWQLTGGAAHVTTASNAASTGGYLLTEHAWDEEWIAAQGFPPELLPELRADDAEGAEFGFTEPELLGVRAPLRASMGDQHAALLALGGLTAGAGMCMYGTGAFVDVATGDRPAWPRTDVTGVLAQPGWRSGSRTWFSLEGYASTVGSALRWLCDDLGLFASPQQVGELATAVEHAPHGPRFVPALAGVRVPVWRPEATGALSGLSLATGRAELARAVLEGIAHSVADLVDGVAATMGAPLRRLRVGGGVAGSDQLLQLQADLLGLELERAADSATASLRGSAYLAGAGSAGRAGEGRLWASLAEVVEARSAGEVFAPRLAPSTRTERRAAWRSHLARHLDTELPDLTVSGGLRDDAAVPAAHSARG